MEIRHCGTAFLKTLRIRSPLNSLFCRHLSRARDFSSSTIEAQDGDLKERKAEKVTHREERLQKSKAENFRDGVEALQRIGEKQIKHSSRNLRTVRKANNARLEPTLARLRGETLYRVISSPKEGKDYYRIGVGSSYLTMPSKIANGLWHFDQLPKDQRLIKLTMDVSDGPHEHAWAKKALEFDTAARLGIKIQHREHEPIWLHSESGTSVVFANSWTDWIEGKIKDPERHRWGNDRYPFIGPMCEVFAPSSGGAMFKDVRKRLMAMLKGEPLQPQWRFTKGHEARLARYKALNGDFKLPEPNDYKSIFDFGLAQLRVLGSRRRSWRA